MICHVLEMYHYVVYHKDIEICHVLERYRDTSSIGKVS